MKKTILSLSIVAILSLNVQASVTSDRIGDVLLRVASTAVTIYSPVLGMALTSAGMITILSAADESIKKEVQQAVNNDAQQFYLNGVISPALKLTVESLKSDDSSLTDSEAIDLLVEAVN